MAPAPRARLEQLRGPLAARVAVVAAPHPRLAVVDAAARLRARRQVADARHVAGVGAPARSSTGGLADRVVPAGRRDGSRSAAVRAARGRRRRGRAGRRRRTSPAGSWRPGRRRRRRRGPGRRRRGRGQLGRRTGRRGLRPASGWASRPRPRCRRWPPPPRTVRAGASPAASDRDQHRERPEPGAASRPPPAAGRPGAARRSPNGAEPFASGRRAGTGRRHAVRRGMTAGLPCRAWCAREPVLAWYADSGPGPALAPRPASTPWAVLVSEVMLQQTPVRPGAAGVRAWLARWPTPAAWPRSPPARRCAMWGKLGYPRRALRLHAARRGDRGPARRGGAGRRATSCCALPGVGAYTARGGGRFAFGRRQPVRGHQRAPGGGPRGRRAGRRRAARRPARDLRRGRRAAAGRRRPGRRGSAVAVMELGALVCTARAPALRRLPARAAVRLAAGRLARRTTGPARAAAALRRHRPAGARAAAGRAARRRRAGPAEPRWTRPGPTPRSATARLDGLVADGLVDPLPDGSFALPT